MTSRPYPKVSTAGLDGVPSSPRFPAIEESVLGYWDADDTFRASIDQRDPGVDGGNEFVFYDGPPFANGLPALRPPADRLRQGPDPALPHDARPAGRAPLRLGHPRAAGGAGGDAPEGHQDHRRDPRARHRDSSTTPAGSRC